jgi:hypothetical protein
MRNARQMTENGKPNQKQASQQQKAKNGQKVYGWDSP